MSLNNIRGSISAFADSLCPTVTHGDAATAPDSKRYPQAQIDTEDAIFQRLAAKGIALSAGHPSPYRLRLPKGVTPKPMTSWCVFSPGWTESQLWWDTAALEPPAVGAALDPACRGLRYAPSSFANEICVEIRDFSQHAV